MATGAAQAPVAGEAEAEMAPLRPDPGGPAAVDGAAVDAGEQEAARSAAAMRSLGNALETSWGRDRRRGRRFTPSVYGRGSSVQSTTGFSTDPIPSISQRTRSPGSRKIGGSRKTPTPAGVPVAIRSPGSSVMWREMNAISSGIEKTRAAVVPS